MTDPVILWLNGGPGSTGIIGMLTELGQLQTMPSLGEPRRGANGTTPPLYYNMYGWTKVGSLFTVEQPKGVGFSYCSHNGPCINDDESTSVILWSRRGGERGGSRKASVRIHVRCRM